MNDMMDDEEGGSIPAECMNEADMAVLMAGGEGMDMNALSEPCLVALMEQNNDDESVPDECMNEADIALFTAWGENSSPTMDQLAQLSEECFAALTAQHDDDDHDGEDHDDDDHDDEEMPFSNCAEFAAMGLCLSEVSDAMEAPAFFAEGVCCKTCSRAKEECSDSNGIFAMFGMADMKCKDLPAMVGGADLCEDDSAIGALANTQGISWTDGMYAKLRCRTCNPPAKTVAIKMEGTMDLDIAVLPAADSAEFEILAMGLLAALKDTIMATAGPKTNVEIVSIGGQEVPDHDGHDHGRALANQEVVFEVIVVHDIREGEDVPTAEEAAGFTSAITDELQAIEPEAFTELVVAEMAEAAEELVEAGVISEEEAAAAVTDLDIEVSAPEVAEVEVDHDGHDHDEDDTRTTTRTR